MTKILLKEAIPALLYELESAGLKPATITHYRRAYRKFEKYAKAKGQTKASTKLEESFTVIQSDKMRMGVLQPREFRTYRRAARMLVDYGTTGSFTWRTYYFIRQPVPDSKKYQEFRECSKFCVTAQLSNLLRQLAEVEARPREWAPQTLPVGGAWLPLERVQPHSNDF